MPDEQLKCSCGGTADLCVDSSCKTSVTETGQIEYRHEIRCSTRCRKCGLDMNMKITEHTNSNTPRIPFKRWVEMGKEMWQDCIDARIGESE